MVTLIHRLFECSIFKCNAVLYCALACSKETLPRILLGEQVKAVKHGPYGRWGNRPIDAPGNGASPPGTPRAVGCCWNRCPTAALTSSNPNLLSGIHGPWHHEHSATVDPPQRHTSAESCLNVHEDYFNGLYSCAQSNGRTGFIWTAPLYYLNLQWKKYRKCNEYIILVFYGWAYYFILLRRMLRLSKWKWACWFNRFCYYKPFNQPASGLPLER
jgi:hypothetical protein